MKKLNFILFFILIVSCILFNVSCSKNEDNIKSDKWYIGTWYWCNGYEYSKNGKIKVEYIITLNDGNKGTWEYCYNGRLDNITYEYSKEDRTINFVEYHETYTFTEVNDTIYLHYTEDGDFDDFKYHDFWLRAE